VVRALDELGIERPVIAGYSMGGRLALYLALRYPDRCAGLFLESASPGVESEEERTVRRKADEEKAKRLESRDLEAFLGDWYRQPLFESLARNEDLLQRTIEARRHNDPVELARSLRGMGTGSQPSLWGELEGLTVPALAVAGGLDGKYVRVSSLMAGISPGVEPVVIPGVGHDVHDEAPAEYVALLGSFLDRLSFALG
jgi:2-succinyl-6-hydroxy-2,4-cyclohexadiene-1-carboxylate synthase